MKPFEDLESPKSMLEFHLGMVLLTMLAVLDEPVSDPDEQSAALHNALLLADDVIAEWFGKYREEFEDATGEN